VTRGCLVIAALVTVLPWPAAAQTRRAPAGPPAQRRLELGIGGGVAGGLALGAIDATLLSNNTSASPFRLFSADTRLAPSAVIEARLGYRATPRLTIEGIVTVGKPDLTTSLGADAENAAAVDATGTLIEYVVTGGATWRLWPSPRRQWTLFVSGGAGVARQVHQGQSLIENGFDGYVGGGLIYPLGSSRTGTSRTGLRLDGRVHLLSGGVAEGAGVSPRGALTGSVFVAF
jgi:hypothetical protein